jgi:dolichol-phosphate mannosyltransferase
MISIIVPMFNEQEALGITLGTVIEQMESCGHAFELVCVDDGSRDRTAELLAEWSERDARIVPLILSRNFGKEAALAAGLAAATGDAAILIDADMQHPPTLIPTMVDRWLDGYDIVNAVKRDRGRERLAYRIMAATFNMLMGAAAGARHRGASDFKLLDRQVIDAIDQCPERHRFFRGLVTWVGFRETSVPFEVAPRAAGTTKWSLVGLIRYSLRNLLAFSAFPLKLTAALGLLGLLVVVAVSSIALYQYATGTAIGGFTTVIFLQSIIGGGIFASLGVLALYISEMYEEQKQRPLFIVRRPRSSITHRIRRPDRHGDDGHASEASTVRRVGR